MNAYLSEDGKIMTMDVVFKANPYSNEAIEQIDSIEATVERVTKDTKLENAQVAIGESQVHIMTWALCLGRISQGRSY